MTETKALTKIDFTHITLADKALYEGYLANEQNRGCEFSFANLYLWGRQRFAVVGGHIALFSQFDRRSVYPYPIGNKDKKAVLDAIIEDARARDIPCRITGLSDEARKTVEQLYPNKFRFHCDEGSFDYVYSIDDLADLGGRKYHAKRNHLNRFYETHPNFTVQPICDDNVPLVKRMLEGWYSTRMAENPNSDFHMEHAALDKALRDHKELSLEGLVLFDGDEVLAFTLASRLSTDTFDVHFEKARSDVQGAYPAINREFAKYIRDKYPEVKFLDREEDMGLEGLRKAKQSYYPHHMVKKYWACLLEDGYDY
ncbi:MAG: DUF2156 domain-containing protein [Ruminococcaceae bacterium]|nr:DUF2156 domain-containing protein [Oscillospiraceae bacterium]